MVEGRTRRRHTAGPTTRSQGTPFAAEDVQGTASAPGDSKHQDAHGDAPQQGAEEDQDTFSDTMHTAAHRASIRAPTRHRSKRSGDTQATISVTLSTFNNLPEHLQDNEFIHTRHRMPTTVGNALRSIIGVHTETGNIWSHLLGFLLFVWLTCVVVVTPPAPPALSCAHLEQLWDTVKADIQYLPELLQHPFQPHQSECTSPPCLPDHPPGSRHHHLNATHHMPKPHTPDHNLDPGSLPAGSSCVPGAPDHSTEAGASHHSAEGVCGAEGRGASAAGDGPGGGPAAAPASLHSMREAVSWGVQTGLASAHTMQDAMQHHIHHLARHVEEAVAGVFSYPTPRWPVYVFCAGAMTCLLFSTMCHLLGCCQKHITQRLWRLDYTGIAVLIVASFYPAVYYSFLCAPIWRTFYLSLVTIMGAGTVMVSLLDQFQSPAWRPFRASLFAALGLFGTVPILHGCFLHYNVWAIQMATLGDGIMGATYLIGAAIYAKRVPERWYPGKFDILLSSHQIFHIFVVIAACLHWRVVLLLVEWRDASGGCVAPVTSGPLHSVLDDMKALGHELMHIDQVWSHLYSFAASHLGLTGLPATADNGSQG